MTPYETPHSIELAHPARKRVSLGICRAPDILRMWIILHLGCFILSNDDQFRHCAENAQFSACFSTSALRSTTRSPSYTDAIRTALTDCRAPARSLRSSRPSLPMPASTRAFFGSNRVQAYEKGGRRPPFSKCLCMSSYMRHNYSAHCTRRSNRTPRGNRSRSTSRRSPAVSTPP